MNSSPAPTAKPRQSRPSEGEGAPIGEWLADLWEGRYLFLATLAVVTVVGAFFTWQATPLYESESLLQLPEKKAIASDPSFSKVGGLFNEPADATAEVEILKSDLILGRAVSALDLDLSIQPQFLPVIGRALARGQANLPRLTLTTFEIPEQYLGKTFHITARTPGHFLWRGPDSAPLATGQPGETLVAVQEGENLTLKVGALVAKPGQDFLVVRKPMVVAVAELRANLEVAERGKLTNVIGLTFKADSPTRSAATLKEIVNQYLRYKLERKGSDATRTLALLEAKIKPLKADLEAAEDRLSQFRRRTLSVDLPREAESLLTHGANLAGQISALEQKKQEALRIYRGNSDVVTTIDLQIQKLKSEGGQVSSAVRALPETQQELVRLTRAVQVNTDLYTALLNNIQQLQVTSGGDTGSAAVVDPARPNPLPIGAKPSVMVAFYAALGALAGVGLVMLRLLLSQGIKDHRLIESKLGLTVVVTIPHSQDQDQHAAALGKAKPGQHLLATQQPDDLAIESLHSLRTTILFTLKDAANPCIMITGPSPGVGKSFLCANLAIILAQTGDRVLLVDADLRRGTLHRYFGLRNRLSGLSDILAGRGGWMSFVHATGQPGLDLITTGILPADSSALLLAPRLGRFLDEAASTYKFILLDVPPLLPVTDATIVGAKAGTVLLVAKYGQHSLDELRACQQRLEDHQITLNGCIFNDIKPTGLGGYQDYRYAYHYKYK